MEVKISDDVLKAIKIAEVGVLICRFQVDELHTGHRELIEYVLSNHNKVIIFLGIAKAKSRKNPLDFATRQAMILAEYPDVVVLPLNDQRSNTLWSKTLDEKCREPFGEKKCVLYGSRDSFIPYYDGRNKTVELEPSVDMNATAIRVEISRAKLNSRESRRGAIHEIYSQRPTTYPAVDVVVSNREGQILLAKKPNEKLFRFVGGFVDREDASYEVAALRELREETGGNLNCHSDDVRYILSHKVDDWRYRGTENGIMSTLYHVTYASGFAKASDDIVHVEWVDAYKLSNEHGIMTMIMPEHREMMAKFIAKAYKEDLIENLGNKLEEVANVTYNVQEV